MKKSKKVNRGYLYPSVLLAFFAVYLAAMLFSTMSSSLTETSPTMTQMNATISSVQSNVGAGFTLLGIAIIIAACLLLSSMLMGKAI